MLKRKRPDVRPPSTKNSGEHAYGAVAPPITPQPQKAVAAFEASYAEVLRALKKARGFERQRIAKRMLEEKKLAKGGKKVRTKVKAKTKDTHGEDGRGTNASEEHLKRLEREMQVLKELDYEVSARVHLANAMMRSKGLAEAPGPLGAHLQLASEVLSQRIKAYRTEDIHNVTSALYNRPFVRDAVVKAVRSMCQLLGVPLPERQSKGKRDNKDKSNETAAKGNTADKEIQQIRRAKTDSPKASASGGDEEGDDSSEKADNIEYSEKDDEAIERELAKYDTLLGGSGGEESATEDSGDSENDSDNGLNDDEVVAKLRAKYKAAVAKGLWRDDGNEISDEDEEDESEDEEDGESEDEFAGFSAEEEEESDQEEENIIDDFGDEVDNSSESESESDDDLRPRKRAATSSSSTGGSHFLPSLMGGYVSDGDDGSDDGGRRATIADDEAAAERMLGGPRKNRRGQRARQAIWEKKYKLLAKHVLEAEKNEKPNVKKGKKDSKDKKGTSGGWDAKRGAVDASDAPRWMRRKMGLTGRLGPVGGGNSGKNAQTSRNGASNSGSTKNLNANAQVSGVLHPSWEAARKAKDKAQTAAFEGKKIVFD
ncbi:hypothetical protein SEPCBS119000_001305 [Sporothrix epigloea]|uniref:Bud22 domain-containing protein n=1 Tax=Sporothrix epigloea TaxID=1892477 RepID=A0ABP0D9Y6_9PEZI